MNRGQYIIRCLYNICSSDGESHKWRHQTTDAHNWPNSQIPKSNCSISNNAPLKTEMRSFLFWMVHCRIWSRCIVGHVNLVHSHLLALIFRISLTQALWEVIKVAGGSFGVVVGLKVKTVHVLYRKFKRFVGDLLRNIRTKDDPKSTTFKVNTACTPQICKDTHSFVVLSFDVAIYEQRVFVNSHYVIQWNLCVTTTCIIKFITCEFQCYPIRRTH